MVTRHRSPTHCTLSIATTTVFPSDGFENTRSGVTHSCKLNPPCVYSVPALKQYAPGAQATACVPSQNHPAVGTSACAPGLITAQRAHLHSVRYFFSGRLGSPPGASSQPWSVTTRTACHPASSKCRIRSSSSSSCSSIWPASFACSLCPNASNSPHSDHPRAFSAPGCPASSPCKTW